MTKSDYENLLKRIEKNISNTSSSGKRFELPQLILLGKEKKQFLETLQIFQKH